MIRRINMIPYSRFAVIAAACSLLLQGCNTFNVVKTIPAGTDLNQITSDASNNESRSVQAFFSAFSDNYQTILKLPSYSFSIVGPATGPGSYGGDVYAFSSGGQLLVVQLGGTATGRTSANLADSVAQTGYAASWPAFFAAAYNANTNAGVLNSVPTVKDAGKDSSGLIGWGRWTSAVTLVNGTQIGCCSDNQSVHYIFGTASPNGAIPLSGLATYTLVGGTSPTLSDGSAAPGVLTSGTVGVVWGGATANTHIALDLQGTINGYTFLVQSPVGNDSPVVYDPVTRTFSGSWEQVGSAALSSASGFFAGSSAQALALTYSTPATVGGVPSSTVFIQGAAGFRRQ